MLGRLAVQGPKPGGQPATSWVDCLQKNLETFGAVPRKGKGRSWVAFGVVVKDGTEWMTAAKNVGKSRNASKPSEQPLNQGIIGRKDNLNCLGNYLTDGPISI